MHQAQGRPPAQLSRLGLSLLGLLETQGSQLNAKAQGSRDQEGRQPFHASLGFHLPQLKQKK